MLDIQTRVATMKRPLLLTRAVRFGVDDYRRNIHLRRILQTDDLPRHAEALVRLLDIEAEMNALRKESSANYAPGRHVEMLIAIAGEDRLMRATTRSVSYLSEYVRETAIPQRPVSPGKTAHDTGNDDAI